MSAILNEREIFCNQGALEWDKLQALLRQGVAEGQRLDQLERQLFAALLRVGRACLEDVVQSAGDGDRGATIERSAATLRRSPEKQRRVYRSIFGAVPIERYVYAVRAKQKIQAAPLDEQLGLPADETSYVLEDWLGALSVNMPYQSAAAWLNQTLGLAVGSTTAENRVRKLGAYVASYRAARPAPAPGEEGELLVVSADGKGLPIRQPWETLLAAATGKKPHPRPRQTTYEISAYRRARGDKPRTQRTTVGACYSIAGHVRDARDFVRPERIAEPTAAVPRPQHKRLWAELSTIDEEGRESRGAERVFQQLAAEVAARDPTGVKPLFCILDGDRSLWKLQQQYLPQAVGIVDLYHVLEKLWRAAQVFHADGSTAAEQFVRRYLSMLLEGKVDSVRGVFRRWLTHTKLTPTKRRQLAEVIEYLRAHRAGMRYDRYLARGAPIGSGVIEGACKHVVGDRFCGAGMRWEIAGAQPLLNLRATHLADEWPKFIAHRIQTEQITLHRPAA